MYNQAPKKEHLMKSGINQYTGRQRTIPVLVYENNLEPIIYEDKESLGLRQKNCGVCG
jgi:hypothetical protein